MAFRPLRLRRAREILSEASAPVIWENAMATLAGQRAQFTWALNQYNLSEDPETRAKFAKNGKIYRRSLRMALRSKK
jgi:hypothetical protein